MSHLLHLLPRIIAEQNGQAQYYCRACQKITDWLPRPLKPYECVVCQCGFFLEKIPLIVEGPRAEDGGVKYKCDHCGNVTPWQSPPLEPGYQVVHGCRSIPKPVRAAQATVLSPCAMGKIADAELNLLNAAKKVEITIPELTQYIQQELLPRLAHARELAMRDET